MPMALVLTLVLILRRFLVLLTAAPGAAALLACGLSPITFGASLQAPAPIPLAVRVAAIAPASDPFSWCWDAAAQAIGVSADLLRGIAETESRMRLTAHNPATDDYGLMQIHHKHLPALVPLGITKERLLAEPCTSIRVGAAVLQDLVARKGATWNAVGAYNAGCGRLQGAQCIAARERYVAQVYRHYRRHASRQPALSTIQAASRPSGSSAPPPTPSPRLRYIPAVSPPAPILAQTTPASPSVDDNEAVNDSPTRL